MGRRVKIERDLAILECLQSGLTYSQIQAKLGVAPAQISRAKKRAAAGQLSQVSKEDLVEKKEEIDLAEIEEIEEIESVETEQNHILSNSLEREVEQQDGQGIYESAIVEIVQYLMGLSPRSRSGIFYRIRKILTDYALWRSD